MKLYKEKKEDMLKATKYLLERVDPSLYSIIADVDLPYRKMRALKLACMPAGLVILQELYGQIENMKLKSGESVQEYLNILSQLRADILSVPDGEYSETQLKNKVIRGMVGEE